MVRYFQITSNLPLIPNNKINMGETRMARQETCILTNMCMIYDRDNILVQDRLNPDWPGITFPGGHIEPNESFVDSVIREVKEETGLDITNVQLCGVKQWTQPDQSFRYIVFFFKTNTYSGELKSSDEGKVFWINKNELSNYTLAEGFDSMFEVFNNDNLCENYHWIDSARTWNMINK